MPEEDVTQRLSGEDPDHERTGAIPSDGGPRDGDADAGSRSDRRRLGGPGDDAARELLYRNGPAYAAELIGTMLLVFFIVMVLAVGAPDPEGLGFNDFAVIGLVHMFALMVLITSLGGISGAHFNPAITIALLAKRLIGGADALIYVICQLVGALLGAALAKALVPEAAESIAVGATLVNEDRFVEGDSGRAFMAELIGTFMLMWAVMATAVDPRGDRNWAPFVIGATLALAVMTIAPMTGGGFNPARSFGPGVLGDMGSFGDFLFVYVLGPVFGALAAAFVYSAIVLGPREREEDRPVDHLV